MALLYFLSALAGAGMLFFRGYLSEMNRDPGGAVVIVIYGVALIVLSVPLMVAYAVALFLPSRPWVWVFHLVLICIGFTSPCCLPVTIPLLVFWIKPATRIHFGRAA